jgi:hypothetical protein
MEVSRTARWSRYLIYGILATLPLERIPSLELIHPVSATVRISQVLGLALICINLPLLWHTLRDILGPPWRWLLVFLGVCLVSAATALDHKRAVLVIVFTVFVAVLARTVSLRMELNKLSTYARILIGTGIATCCFGLYQFFGDLLGLPAQFTGLRPQYTSAIFGFPRVQSTGLEPLYYDNFLLIPVALALGYFAWKKSWKMWAAIVLFSAIIVVNISRGAIVALLLLTALSAGLMLWRKQWRMAGLAAAGVTIGFMLAFGLIWVGSTISKNAKSKEATSNFAEHAVTINSGESSQFRTLSRNRAVQIWLEHPLLGVGPGNFGKAVNKLDPRNFVNSDAIVNNEPVEILAETGILGLTAMALFVVSFGRLVVEVWRRVSLGAEVKVWFQALVLALIAIGVQYQTFSTLYITHIWVAIGLLMGLVYGSGKGKKTSV